MRQPGDMIDLKGDDSEPEFQFFGVAETGESTLAQVVIATTTYHRRFFWALMYQRFYLFKGDSGPSHRHFANIKGDPYGTLPESKRPSTTVRR